MSDFDMVMCYVAVGVAVAGAVLAFWKAIQRKYRNDREMLNNLRPVNPPSGAPFFDDIENMGIKHSLSESRCGVCGMPHWWIGEGVTCPDCLNWAGEQDSTNETEHSRLVKSAGW
jgi:hypothetical protein